jgi:hypothetical protein
MKNRKPKFKVGDRVIITSTKRVYVGPNLKGADETGYKSVPKTQYGTAYYRVLGVQHAYSDVYRYTVLPCMADWWRGKICSMPDSDYFFQHRFFVNNWENRETVREDELRRYLKKDMDIEYVVFCNGEEMYRGKNRKFAMSYKSDSPWVDIHIVEVDLNTRDVVKQWANHELKEKAA